jgi:hypothetical protein
MTRRLTAESRKEESDLSTSIPTPILFGVQSTASRLELRLFMVLGLAGRSRFALWGFAHPRETVEISSISSRKRAG